MFHLKKILFLTCMFYLSNASNETFSEKNLESVNGEANCFSDTIPNIYLNELLEGQNPSSSCPPKTDSGAQPPFKYSFAFVHRYTYSGGWRRLLIVTDLPISKRMSGNQVRLYKGGIRELHWHPSSEWGIVIYGEVRVTMVDKEGRGFVDDLKAGDIWLFPPGIPHSIQGIGDDGALFHVVFDAATAEETFPFLLSDWANKIPREVLGKDFQTPVSTFANLPPNSLLSTFAGQLPQSLEVERMQVSKVTGYSTRPCTFHASQMMPNITRKGGQVKIVDARNFPTTDMAAAVVTLRPGALRELHWHPNADEWLYFIMGKARVGVFTAGGEARTMDFQAGDVGYVPQSFGHYIENTCGDNVVFVEVFHKPYFEDISLAQWLAHTPPVLVDQHIRTGLPFINQINKLKAVIVP